MSYFTDYAENKLVDFVRGQTLTLPTNWYIGLLSAGSDSAFTELSGSGYARQTLARTLAAMSGTQGGGTTLASTGSSHATSNNALINFGTAGAAWGSFSHIGIFDASTGGNLWAYIPRAGGTVTINNGDPVSLPIGSMVLTLGLTGGMTNYLSNKMIDLLWRGQAYSWPATLYLGYYTAAPTNAGGGSEVASGGYARVPLVPSLANLSGTQAAGSTAASSGTGGLTSNNVALTYPAPSADQGTVLAEGVFDASTAGNLLLWGLLSIPKTVTSGADAPSHDAGTFSITFA